MGSRTAGLGMLFWGFVAYLLMGCGSVFFGPAARSIRNEIGVWRAGGAPAWKLLLGRALLSAAVVLLWPILVPSAARAAKPRVSDPVGGLRRLQADIEQLIELDPEAVDADELPDACGPFGRSPDNPVPTRTISGSINYLARLRSPDGLKASYSRLGSRLGIGVSRPIDVYEIRHAEGGALGLIYVSPYHRRTSAKAPAGLGLIDPQTGALRLGAPFSGEGEEMAASGDAPSPEADNDIDRLRVSAEAGDTRAQYALGLRLVHGQGTSRNAVLGEEWLTKAAASGDADAGYALGKLHLEGILLDKGVRQAVYWLKKSASKGHAEAKALLPSAHEQEARVSAPRRPVTATEPVDPGTRLRRSGAQATKAEGNRQPAWTSATSAPARAALWSGFQDGWERGDEINQTLYQAGFDRGEECREIARARIHDALQQSRFGEMSSNGAELERLPFVAKAVANELGYVSADAVNGMEDLVDGSDVLFDERRAAFKAGVLAAIEGDDDAMED